MHNSALFAGFLFLLLVLTSFRITRLVISDTFPPVVHTREWLIREINRDWFEDLLTCGWCSGTYIASAVVSITWIFLPLHYPALHFFAVAALTGILAEHYA